MRYDRWKIEAPILGLVFLDLVGFGMILPDIQTRLESYGARGWLIGSLLASYFLIQMLASPLWGRVSDRLGRKPVLLLCGLFSALSMLIYALADSVVWVLLSRVLAGMGAANVVAAQAFLADRTPESQRAAALGRMSAATTSGLIFGPALGGWLSALGGNALLGVMAAGASGLGTLWVAVSVPGGPPPQARAPRGPNSPVDFALLKELPALRSLFLLAALALLALACLEGTFGRLIRHQLGYGPLEFGLLFGFEALLSVAAQALLLAPLSARLRPVLLLRLAYCLQGAGLALMPFAPNLAGLFAACALYAVGIGLANPALNTLCSALTPADRQGEMFGLLQSVRAFGFLLGPVLGGILFDWRVEAPYLLAGAVMFCAGWLAATYVEGRALAPTLPGAFRWASPSGQTPFAWLRHLLEPHEHAHRHEPLEHAHWHRHDAHHQHHPETARPATAHFHWHQHAPLTHSHPHQHDAHHHHRHTDTAAQ
jgi:MFS family permease